MSSSESVRFNTLEYQIERMIRKMTINECKILCGAMKWEAKDYKLRRENTAWTLHNFKSKVKEFETNMESKANAEFKTTTESKANANTKITKLIETIEQLKQTRKTKILERRTFETEKRRSENIKRKQYLSCCNYLWKNSKSIPVFINYCASYVECDVMNMYFDYDKELVENYKFIFTRFKSLRTNYLPYTKRGITISPIESRIGDLHNLHITMKFHNAYTAYGSYKPHHKFWYFRSMPEFTLKKFLPPNSSYIFDKPYYFFILPEQWMAFYVLYELVDICLDLVNLIISYDINEEIFNDRRPFIN